VRTDELPHSYNSKKVEYDELSFTDHSTFTQQHFLTSS